MQAGHADFVYGVLFSPDNRWLASSSADGVIKIWDLENGLEFRTLGVRMRGGWAFSPDGRLLALGSDNLLTLWEIDSGRELLSLPTNSPLTGLAFDPSGKKLIAFSSDHTVTTWDAANGARMNSVTVGVSDKSVFTEFTPNGQWVLSSGWGDSPSNWTVDLWNATTGEKVYSHPKPTGDMNGPTVSPDGQWLVSTDQHMSIRLWDIAKGGMAYSLYGDPNPNSYTNRNLSFAFSPDGKELAVGDDENQTVRLLDLATGRVLSTFEKTFASELTFSDDGSRIAAVRDRSVAVIELASGRVLQTLRGYTRGLNAIAVSRDGQYLAVSTQNYAVKLWDLSVGRELRSLGGQFIRTDAGSGAVAFSPDGHWIASKVYEANASGYMEGIVKVWDSATGHEMLSLSGFDWLSSVAFSPDGRLLAASHRGGIRIWDTSTWHEIQSISLSPREWVVQCVAFSPDGRWLAATFGESIYIWNAADVGGEGRTLRTSIKVSMAAGIMAFSWDSKRLASVDSSGHTADLWEVESGKHLLSIPAADVEDLAFSPDGGWLAAAGKDHNVHLWDASDGHELHTFAGHNDKVNAVAFTPDGHWLISASDDGSTRIWDARTGAEVALLCSINDTGDWAVVTPDGLFDGSTDGAQKLVAWRIGKRLYPADRFYARNYIPRLLSRQLGGEKPKPQLSLEALKPPPTVRLASPSSGAKLTAGPTEVSVEVKDQGGGITEVRLFQNAKLVGKQIGNGSGTYRFQVDLVAGENVIKGSALSSDGVEANDDQVRLVAEARVDEPAPAKPALRLLVAGVSQYEDPAFDLDFARPDAEAIAGFFEKDKLFSRVDSIKLYDQAASKSAIEDALRKLGEQTHSDDLIVIYMAGHGVNLGEQFYFLPHDMRRETDDDAAIRKYGIPASDLADALMNAKALKEVLILDTCESEGALPLLAKAITYRARGVSTAEEKAVKMLARSYGVYLIAASTTQQEAFEVPELGHGVLTSALLSGLGEKGEPKAPMVNEGIVTVGSLVEYVYAQVPELTEKFRHQKQYPVTSSTGTNFPLWAK